MKEDFLIKKLEERKAQNAFRELRVSLGKVDFCSNDYLGIVKNGLLETAVSEAPGHHQILKSGSTGSRLLSGNYPLIEETESYLARFHDAPAGLLFNSGYDANIGLLSAVPQRGDTVLYDYLAHASLRDGIRLNLAQSFAFKHNDLADLEQKLQQASGNIFVVTESVFSMDGDKAPLREITFLCDRFNANLVVDEAHATGVVGVKGEGLVQQLGLQEKCFARIHTFGKACGAHGAIVLGSEHLKNYLVNFSRSFIYTTSLPEISVAAIKASYKIFPNLIGEREHLDQLIGQFQMAEFKYEVLKSGTPIQVIIIPGNDEVKLAATKLQQAGCDVRPILYPSVPRGQERLRMVLHAFNSYDEVAQLISLLQ